MKEKALSVIEILKVQYPDALCALQYKKDYELRSPSVCLPSAQMQGSIL